MKKKVTKAPSDAHDGKGFLALAGEAFSVLGEEIVEGKDKLMDAASEKFTTVKKAIKKKFAKKKAAAKKIAPKKKAAVKKPVKKSPVKKATRKKPASKKKTVLKKKK